MSIRSHASCRTQTSRFFGFAIRRSRASHASYPFFTPWSYISVAKCYLQHPMNWSMKAAIPWISMPRFLSDMHINLWTFEHWRRWRLNLMDLQNIVNRTKRQQPLKSLELLASISYGRPYLLAKRHLQLSPHRPYGMTPVSLHTQSQYIKSCICLSAFCPALASI